MGDKKIFPVKRIVMGLLIFVVLGGLISWTPVWFFSLVVMLLVLGALHDYVGLLQNKAIHIARWPVMVLGSLFPLFALLEWGSWEWRSAFLILLSLTMLFVRQFTRLDSEHALTHIALSLFPLIYIAWCFSTLIEIRVLANGWQWVAFLLLTTKGSDIGAYLVGSLIGQTRLIPRISPQKSVEGACGGVVFSLIAAWLSSFFLPGYDLGHLMVMGFVLSIVAMGGDLAESMIKRDCEAKDSGALIPGMGGVLDVIDSILFSVPFFYIYLIRFLGVR